MQGLCYRLNNQKVANGKINFERPVGRCAGSKVVCDNAASQQLKQNKITNSILRGFTRNAFKLPNSSGLVMRRISFNGSKIAIGKEAPINLVPLIKKEAEKAVVQTDDNTDYQNPNFQESESVIRYDVTTTDNEEVNALIASGKYDS